MEAKHLWQGTIALIYIAIGLGIVAGVAYLLYGTPTPKGAKTSAPISTSTTAIPSPLVAGGFRFACDGGKAIEAVFARSSAKLMLSDGRQITLPQAISADGARYANPDESFVFWNKGNTAFIDENGVRTYDGCATGQ